MSERSASGSGSDRVEAGSPIEVAAANRRESLSRLVLGTGASFAVVFGLPRQVWAGDPGCRGFVNGNYVSDGSCGNNNIVGDSGCGVWMGASGYDDDGLCGKQRTMSTTWNDGGCGHNNQQTGQFDEDGNCAKAQQLPGGGTVYVADIAGGNRYPLVGGGFAVDPDQSCGMVVSEAGATDSDGDCRAPIGLTGAVMEDSSCHLPAVGGGIYADLDCGGPKPDGHTWGDGV